MLLVFLIKNNPNTI